MTLPQSSERLPVALRTEALESILVERNLVDPKVSHGLGTALLQEWPSYAAYFISFSTIVVIWVNHHGIIDAIGRFDRVLLFLNGLLLLTVAYWAP